MHTKWNRAALAVVFVAGQWAPSLYAADKKPPATQPAAPTIDQILDQLSKVDQKSLAAHLVALQAEAKKLVGDAKALRDKAAALRSQAGQLDARRALVLKRIALLSTLVKKPATQPAKKAAAKPVKPAPKKAMAAKPKPAPAKPVVMKAKPKPKPKPAPAKPAPKPKPAAKTAAKKMSKMPEPKAKLVTYAEHIKPIFVEKCAGCHNQDKSKGGLVIDSYTDLMEGGSSGEVIVPGDTGGSRLWLLVDHQEKPHMPPKQPKLEAAKLTLIAKWIEQGAPADANAKPTLAKAPAAKPRMVIVKPTTTGPVPIPTGAPKKLAPPAPRPTSVTALAASPVAPILAVCGSKQILLHNVETKALVAALPYPEGKVQHLEFSRDGRWLAAAGGLAGKQGKVVIFDVISGQRLGELGGQYDTVLCTAVDPYLEFIAVGGSNKKVRVHDLLTDSVGFEITKHTDWVTAMVFSPDATLLATGDRAGGLFVWQADTGRLVFELRGHGGAIQDLAFRPDSGVLASTGDDGTVRLWEMENGRKIKQWGAHGTASLSVDFHPDGRICTSGADHVAKLWKVDGGGIRTFEKLGDWVYQCCFANGGKNVVAGTWTGQLVVFDTETGKRLWQFDTNPKPDAAVALNK